MSLGKGIAITGIWFAVALSGYFIGMGAIGIAMCAMVATFSVAEAGSD